MRYHVMLYAESILLISLSVVFIDCRLLCYICDGETLNDCQQKQRMLRCTRYESSCGTLQYVEHKGIGEQWNRTKQICISSLLKCDEHCDILTEKYFSDCKISCCSRPLCNDVTDHEHTKWLNGDMLMSANSGTSILVPSWLVKGLALYLFYLDVL